MGQPARKLGAGLRYSIGFGETELHVEIRFLKRSYAEMNEPAAAWKAICVDLWLCATGNYMSAIAGSH